jgi:hypothetical protein
MMRKRKVSVQIKNLTANSLSSLAAYSAEIPPTMNTDPDKFSGLIVLQLEQ